jgi:hypothetical protein
MDGKKAEAKLLVGSPSPTLCSTTATAALLLATLAGLGGGATVKLGTFSALDFGSFKSPYVGMVMSSVLMVSATCTEEELKGAVKQEMDEGYIRITLESVFGACGVVSTRALPPALLQKNLTSGNFCDSWGRQWCPSKHRSGRHDAKESR